MQLDKACQIELKRLMMGRKSAVFTRVPSGDSRF